jgi:hypothetical protein
VVGVVVVVEDDVVVVVDDVVAGTGPGEHAVTGVIPVAPVAPGSPVTPVTPLAPVVVTEPLFPSAWALTTPMNGALDRAPIPATAQKTSTRRKPTRRRRGLTLEEALRRGMRGRYFGSR